MAHFVIWSGRLAGEKKGGNEALFPSLPLIEAEMLKVTKGKGRGSFLRPSLALLFWIFLPSIGGAQPEYEGPMGAFPSPRLGPDWRAPAAEVEEDASDAAPSEYEGSTTRSNASDEEVVDPCKSSEADEGDLTSQDALDEPVEGSQRVCETDARQ